MNLRRYLEEALRRPGGMVALLRRVTDLARRGGLRSALERASPRGFNASEYRAWSLHRVPMPVRESPTHAWIALFEATSGRASPLGDGERVAGFSRRLVRSGPNWRDVDAGDAPAASLAQYLPASTEGRTWLVWLAEDAVLDERALQVLDEAAQRFPAARVMYCDDDVRNANGAVAPRFKPAWDREQMTQRNYVGATLALHASLAKRIPSEPVDGRQLADWLKLLAADLPDEAFVHVPQVLVHRGPDAAESTSPVAPAVQFPLAPGTVVSVIIPTRDRLDLLRRCVRSLPDRLSGSIDLVIVDNASCEAATLDFLANIDATVVRVPGAFNFPRLVNAGAAGARGRVLVFLNNDAMLATTDALAELASLAIRPGVGAVGPLLVYDDGRIQAAGVLLGVNRTASNALAGYPASHPFVRDWCSVRRQVSAVNGACLAVERAKFDAAGGFDEIFAVSHNELDFCLKLAQRGYVNLFTPHARVVHSEGATRGYEIDAQERERLGREEQAFVDRWGRLLARTDPAHNPNLSATGDPLRLTPRPLAHAARGPGPFRER